MIQSTQRTSLARKPMMRSTGIRLVISDIMAICRLWRHRIRSRHDLAELEPHQLRDIGVTPEDARREASKPFWH
ncbi:MAG: DUF1127 domain-containing protein [Pseudomonadota bacterium]